LSAGAARAIATARVASSSSAASPRSVDPIEAEAPPTNTRRPICSDSDRSTSSSAPSRTCTDLLALAR
jgi:hypothetical protein